MPYAASRRIFIALGITAGLAASAVPAWADTAYPNKPVTVVVSYPPGGDTDAIARLMSDKLSQRLKQTVIIENRPGAGGPLAMLMSAVRRRTATRCSSRPTHSPPRRWC